jgi:SAM-dependent methyltransferase
VASYREYSEIIEGILRCPSGHIFPIISGVPRLLSNALRKELPQLYPEFFHRHSNLFNDPKISGDTSVGEIKKATIDRFGYEWKHFSDYNADNFKQFIAPLPDNFLEGKLGLDVGCGAGRHARQAAELGAEIVCIDLSQAVDAAYQNNADNEIVHIIQADIYNLPFKQDIFHFIYSLGVLHHLPDSEKGFQILLPYLTTGGSLFVWVYFYTLRKAALEILRYFARPLSNENIRRFAYVCNLIDYGIFINLYRLTRKLPILGRLVERYSPLRVKEYAAYGFQVGFTDWFDRLSAPITNYYKEDEMRNWLKRSGLSNTKLLLEGDSWWWLYGERKA